MIPAIPKPLALAPLVEDPQSRRRPGRGPGRRRGGSGPRLSGTSPTARVPVQTIPAHPEAKGLSADQNEVIGEKVSYRLAQRPGSYVALIVLGLSERDLDTGLSFQWSVIGPLWVRGASVAERYFHRRRGPRPSKY